MKTKEATLVANGEAVSDDASNAGRVPGAPRGHRILVSTMERKQKLVGEVPGG